MYQAAPTLSPGHCECLVTPSLFLCLSRISPQHQTTELHPRSDTYLRREERKAESGGEQGWLYMFL